MITIAASDFGDYLFLVIMLVFGLINWVANKLKEGRQPPQSQQRRPAGRPVASAPPTRNAEEERMRRFLEALGVPSDEGARPTPPPIPQPRPQVPKFEPPVSRSLPPPLPREEPSLDQADTTDEPVEHIRLPDLQTATVREFETVSSRVSADEDGEFLTVAGAVSAVPACVRHPEQVSVSEAPRRAIDSSAILARLRSPDDVRTAVVLSEILGPPRSLRR